MNQYAAYKQNATAEAFFNPVGLVKLTVGDEINGCTVIAIGELKDMQAVVDAENALLPKLSFGDLL